MVREPLARVAYRLRHPQTTVRWRLTLLYGGLFLVCGAALLAITYTLVAKVTVTPLPAGIKFEARARKGDRSFGGPAVVNVPAVPPEVQRLLRSSAGQTAVRIVGRGQRISDLHQLEIWSAIALAIMAVISALLGWLVAGRVLRPLRTITATTSRSQRPTCTSGSRCPARETSSASSRTRSMACSNAWRARSTPNGGSSRTPRTNSAHR